MRQGYGVKRPFLPAEEQAFASLIGLTAAALQAAGETGSSPGVGSGSEGVVSFLPLGWIKR